MQMIDKQDLEHPISVYPLLPHFKVLNAAHQSMMLMIYFNKGMIVVIDISVPHRCLFLSLRYRVVPVPVDERHHNGAS